MRSDKGPILDYVVEVVRKVLTEGDVTHADKDWAGVSVGENLNHLHEHYRQINQLNQATDEHFDHLLCRAAMAAYRRHVERDRG